LRGKAARKPYRTTSYVDLIERVGGGVSIEQEAGRMLKQIREMVAAVDRADGPRSKRGRRRPRRK